MKLYGISGLGADKRVFKYLDLDIDFIPIDWIQPLRGENLSDYSNRLLSTIDLDDDYGFLGVSFGGLVATEMSKHSNPLMTVLISSASTKYELPSIFRLTGKTGLMKVVPPAFFDPPRVVANYLFSTDHGSLLREILDDTDLHFAKWAVNELLRWSNEKSLCNMCKIHGTNDRLIPIARSTDVIPILGGGHFMIVDKAEEVSAAINAYIKRTTTQS